jgi:hypothetical protein
MFPENPFPRASRPNGPECTRPAADEEEERVGIAAGVCSSASRQIKVMAEVSGLCLHSIPAVFDGSLDFVAVML